MDLDEVAHYEPPHQDLPCLQIQLFLSLVLKELRYMGTLPFQVREKYLENEIFSRSGKSQGILWMAREIEKGLGMSGKSQRI